jgi:cbb3-type cytochrome oxidase subunit 3
LPEQTPPERHPDTVPIDHQYEVALINEECAEVCQIIGKSLRFGWASYNPADPTQTNYDLLHNEIGDVEAAIEFGISRGAFDRSKITTAKKAKLAKLSRVAPPVMMVTSGSTINVVKKHQSEGLAAILVFFVFALILIAVGYFAYQHGKQGQDMELRLKVAEEARTCIATQMAAIQPGKAAKPADLTICDRLGKLAQGQ